MEVKSKEATVGQKKTLPTFGREQLLASARYADRKDLVGALLEEGREYTIETVDKLMDEYMKGQVN